MKKTFKILFSVVCTLFVLIAASCTMSADQMVEQYNGKMTEEKPGELKPNSKPYFNNSLLPKDVYRVVEGGTLRFEEARAFFDHKWILKDNKTGQEYNVGDFYITYVGMPDIKLTEGTYTLTLYVKNWNNVVFKDSATIIVVKI